MYLTINLNKVGYLNFSNIKPIFVRCWSPKSDHASKMGPKTSAKAPAGYHFTLKLLPR